MEDRGRSEKNSLIDDLLKAPYKFTFFQAVHLLQSMYPDAVGVGCGGPFTEEIIRFRPAASLKFGASDIESIEKLESDNRWGIKFLMTINFLGLYGSVSPLPTYYTEEILFNDPENNNRRDFLDIFHHRIISLLYRCFEKYRYYIQFRAGGVDTISKNMFSLIGVPDDDTSPIAKKRTKLIGCLGLLGLNIRSASVVARIISHYFDGIRVHIEEFIPTTFYIKSEEQSRLGDRNCSLGLDFIMDNKISDCASKFRVQLGPLEYGEYISFLPNTDNASQLEEIVRLSVVDPLDFDIELTIKLDQIPLLTLADDNLCRLGYTSWLGRYNKNVASVIFSSKI